MGTHFALQGKGHRLDAREDVEPLLEKLKADDKVESISFSENTLGVGACEAIGEVLRSKKSIKTIDLSDIFTSRLLSEIPPALSHLLTSLTTLPDLGTVNLSDNAFGLNTQAPLVTFLESHVPLRHLILNNNGLGPRAGVLIAEALVRLAEKKEAARKEGKSVPTLETIVCGRNRLENGSMIAWAKAFAAHPGVKVVRMVQNGIRPEGIERLIRDGLSHAKGLEVVDLQDNTFTVPGAKALADVLPGWEALVELGVGDCLLKKRGGVLVAKSLQGGRNGKIEILKLAFNDIDREGLKEFLIAAKGHLGKLKRVELNGNRFGIEEGALIELRTLLEGRRAEGDDEDAMDGLSDLDSDEEDEEESDEEKGSDGDDMADEEEAEKVIRADEAAENEPVALEVDKKIDTLAEKLAKTDI